MSKGYKLWSGQINYKSLDDKGAYACIIIRDGIFHNLTEEQRIDMIRQLELLAPVKQENIDLEDMF